MSPDLGETALKILFACGLVLAATPALAQERAYTQRQISQALKAGCAVHQTPQFSGKTMYTPAIVRCPNKQPDRAAQKSTPAR